MMPPLPIEKVVVHPLVLLSITDHYNRVVRDTRKRVVGVLLGTSVKGTIDVTNSYAVPFEEDEKDPTICFLDLNYHESMFSVFRIVNDKDRVVGWYSTGPNLKDNDLCVHGLFNDYVPTPVLVIIDVQSKELGLPTKAYYAVEEVQENTAQKGQKVFVHVPSEIAGDEVEEIGIEHLPRYVNDTTINTLATEVIGKLAALKGLGAQLEEIRSYFDLVIKGKLPINHRILQDVFNLLPPCISNWKNHKDYAIHPYKWLAADGCGLREVQINDYFVKLSEALYVAEQKAREADVAVQSKVQKEMVMMEKEKKHMELWMLEDNARAERIGVVALAGGKSIPSGTLYIAKQKAREAAVAVHSKVQKEMTMTDKEKKHVELQMLAYKARSERTGVVALAGGISIPSDTLYVTEQKARAAVVAVQSKVQKEMMMTEKEKKHMELWMLEDKARAERIGVVALAGGKSIPSGTLNIAKQKAREAAVAVQSKVQKEMMMTEKEKKHVELQMLAYKARSERTGVVALADGILIPSETLYVAEKKAREAVVAVRLKVQKEMTMMTEKEKKHVELQMLEQKARSERTGVVALAGGISIPSETLYITEQKAREAVVAVQSKVQKEMMMTEKEKKHRELWMLEDKARAERIGVVALAGGKSIPSGTLYIAKQKAREAVVAVRSEVQKEMMMTDKEKKHVELQMLAYKARSERTDVVALAGGISIPSENAANYCDTGVEYERSRDGPKETKEEKEFRLQTEAIRAERQRERVGEGRLKAKDAGIGKNKETIEDKEDRLRREKIHVEQQRERERILEANYARIGKKHKISWDRDCDMSEKVTLEMANTEARGGNVQRLFNQEKGMDSGFATDDACNIICMGLLVALSALITMYKPKEDCNYEMYGGADDQLNKIDTEVTGTPESSGPRDRPDGCDNVHPENLSRSRTNLDQGQD